MNLRQLLLLVGVIVLAAAVVLGGFATTDLRDVLALGFAGIAVCFASGWLDRP